MNNNKCGLSLLIICNSQYELHLRHRNYWEEGVTCVDSARENRISFRRKQTFQHFNDRHKLELRECARVCVNCCVTEHPVSQGTFSSRSTIPEAEHQPQESKRDRHCACLLRSWVLWGCRQFESAALCLRQKDSVEIYRIISYQFSSLNPFLPELF